MIAALQASIDAALAARERLHGRGVRETAHALAAAARRWATDAALAAALPEAAALTPAMIAAVLPIVADTVDADTLIELHAREAAPGPPHLVAPMPDHDLWMAFIRDPDGHLIGLMMEAPKGYAPAA